MLSIFLSIRAMKCGLDVVLADKKTGQGCLLGLFYQYIDERLPTT